MVEAESAGEESFFAQGEGRFKGFFGGAVEDEVESSVAGVLRPADGTGAFCVISRRAVGRDNELEGNAETFTEFVGGMEGGEEAGPVFAGREAAGNSGARLEMRANDLLGREMA